MTSPSKPPCPRCIEHDRSKRLQDRMLCATIGAAVATYAAMSVTTTLWVVLPVMGGGALMGWWVGAIETVEPPEEPTA